MRPHVFNNPAKRDDFCHAFGACTCSSSTKCPEKHREDTYDLLQYLNSSEKQAYSDFAMDVAYTSSPYNPPAVVQPCASCR